MKFEANKEFMENLSLQIFKCVVSIKREPFYDELPSKENQLS